MTSEVEIYNLALSHIGITVPVASPTEKSNEAKQCRLHFAHAVRALQNFPYDFLKSTRSLAMIGHGENGDHIYDLPRDMIRLIKLASTIDDDSLPVHDYALRGGQLHCKISPAYLTYTKPVLDSSLFPPSFIDALSWELAARICFPLTKDQKLRQETFQIAQMRQPKAEEINANNEMDSWDLPANHLEARS